MQLRRSHTAGTILSWIGEVTKIWKDRDLEEVCVLLPRSSRVS